MSTRGREHSSANRATEPPQLLDAGRLLGWLEAHAQGLPVRRAIYEGLDARIRRGDFNADEATR